MNTENIDFPALKANYGKTSDEEIKKLLEHINLVVLADKGVGTIHGYYTFDDKNISAIKAKPRGISYTFITVEPNELINDLKTYKEIVFYIKSSSRFFLKPDIGEVFDQMTDEDKEQTKAIYTKKDDYYEVDGTYGEHFVMTAILLN